MAAPSVSNVGYIFFFLVGLLVGILFHQYTNDSVSTGASLITYSFCSPIIYGFIYRRLFRTSLLDHIQFYSICVILLLCFVISNIDKRASLICGMLLGVFLAILSVLLVALNNKFKSNDLTNSQNQKFNQQIFEREPQLIEVVRLNVNLSSGTEDSSTSDSNTEHNSSHTFPE
ncbi:PREDICTED: uncharacterized protein LOC108559939 isoform X1 [Nicrophorus vespilloides]|uniref:Uncharacterized protein LOC108559939 isoform X1 n=1 Tax=Nicrophorus vespilloides TaxID=110193 RepID=A0ABM1ME20_NICVS|nr:PREDICTED: uncharacterized protein LOC108559939 isoform X1 [Nicrophorus vespilloides]